MAKSRHKRLAGAFLAEPERFGLTTWDGLTVAASAAGSYIAARRAFAEPWQVAIGALIGGSIAVVAAQGYMAYKRRVLT